MKWSRFPEYDAALRAGVLEDKSAFQIASDLNEQYGVNLTENQVDGRITRLGLRKLRPAPSPEDRFEAAVAKERQKSQDRAIAREMASAIKGQARWQEFLDIATEAFATFPYAAGEPAKIEFPVGSGTPEKFVALIGDIHIGKMVDPSVVGQTFGYGYPVFQERWARLKNRLLRYFALHSATAPFEAFRIHFLGDGVDGVDMRRGHQARTDIKTASEQMLLLVAAWEELLRELATIGIPIDVIWDYGNHGRVGDFGVNLPADNWDYVAGEVLKIAVRDVQNVSIHVSTLKYHVTQLGPYRVHSSHGDAVKGGDGFAGLPINGLARALAKDTGLHKQIFDLLLTAHFHTPQDLTTQAGRILMNGSWDGGDDYSINQLKAASEPVQLVFGVHPERGISWKSELQLAPSRRVATPAEVL